MTGSPDKRPTTRAVLRGIGAGMAAYIVTYVCVALAASVRSVPLIFVTVAAGCFISVVVLVISIGKLANPRTRAFGAGLMMAFALGTIIGSGVCTAVANSNFGSPAAPSSAP